MLHTKTNQSIFVYDELSLYENMLHQERYPQTIAYYRALIKKYLPDVTTVLDYNACDDAMAAAFTEDNLRVHLHANAPKTQAFVQTYARKSQHGISLSVSDITAQARQYDVVVIRNYLHTLKDNKTCNNILATVSDLVRSSGLFLFDFYTTHEYQPKYNPAIALLYKTFIKREKVAISDDGRMVLDWRIKSNDFELHIESLARNYESSALADMLNDLSFEIIGFFDPSAINAEENFSYATSSSGYIIGVARKDIA